MNAQLRRLCGQVGKSFPLPPFSSLVRPRQKFLPRLMYFGPAAQRTVVIERIFGGR